jgi:hypothetical protein
LRTSGKCVGGNDEQRDDHKVAADGGGERLSDAVRLEQELHAESDDPES